MSNPSCNVAYHAPVHRPPPRRDATAVPRSRSPACPVNGSSLGPHIPSTHRAVQWQAISSAASHIFKHWPPETFLLIIAPDRHQATFGGGERALISERRNLPLTACTTIMRDGNTDQKKRKQCNRHRVVPLDAIKAGGPRHIRSQTVIVFSPSVRGKAAYCSSHPPPFPPFYCPATF